MTNTPSHVLKIVLIQEDARTSGEALSLLRRLAGRLHNVFGACGRSWQIDSQFWKFEWLLDREWREAALASAAEAELIVISAGTDNALPAGVREWIENVLRQKEGKPFALVALMGERSATPPWAWSPGALLRQLAREHGADFFCNLDQQPQQTAPPVAAIGSRREDEMELGPTSDSEFGPWHEGLND